MAPHLEMAWQMQFNVAKCNSMTMSHKKTTTLQLHDEAIHNGKGPQLPIPRCHHIRRLVLDKPR